LIGPRQRHSGATKKETTKKATTKKATTKKATTKKATTKKATTGGWRPAEKPPPR